MAINIGDASCTTGASQRAWSNLPSQMTSQITGETTSQYSARTALLKQFVYSVVKGLADEEIANAEVYNVAGAVETYIAGVGSNGGALIATTYPVAGSIIGSGLAGKLK